MGVVTIAHAELYCPDLEASREHFLETMGFYESRSTGDAVYLRAFGDWQDYSLVLREGDDWGCGHVAWMVESEEDLEEFSGRIEEAGHETEWREPGEEPGQGRALRFNYPGQAPEWFELVHQVDRAFDTVPQEHRSRLKNQPSRKPTTGSGARRIDHVNFSVDNVAECSGFFEDVLDFKLREEVRVDGEQGGAWLSVSHLVHEIAFINPPPNASPVNEIDHVSFYVDGGQTGELLRTADLLMEAGIEIVGGPAKHGISQANFIYYLEPSGNKIEVFGGGYLIFDPHWEPITWTPEDGSHGAVWWGGKAGEHARRQYDYVPVEDSDWSEYDAYPLQSRD